MQVSKLVYPQYLTLTIRSFLDSIAEVGLAFWYLALHSYVFGITGKGKGSFYLGISSFDRLLKICKGTEGR